ncbi:MAG: SDR family NAD(P)-dependent oxidoreductase, partial [Polynucleobacter sp.]|uniref:SDR family NAD(P)-dependent oxidoreductase n=1 Tax=Polynucleobacter sp. TaxID=2029855 RepID=UPI0027171FB9
MDLKGKVAAVTGAAGGIGASIACALAKAGAKVVLSDIQTDKGQEVSRQINANGGHSVFVQHDTTDEAAWIKFIDTALDTFGGLDI